MLLYMFMCLYMMELFLCVMKHVCVLYTMEASITHRIVSIDILWI